MYSDIHVNDAYKNGFRVFRGTNYRDYTREYGEIVKLICLESNLLCIINTGHLISSAQYVAERFSYSSGISVGDCRGLCGSFVYFAFIHAGIGKDPCDGSSGNHTFYYDFYTVLFRRIPQSDRCTGTFAGSAFADEHGDQYLCTL